MVCRNAYIFMLTLCALEAVVSCLVRPRLFPSGFFESLVNQDSFSSVTYLVLLLFILLVDLTLLAEQQEACLTLLQKFTFTFPV